MTCDKCGGMISTKQEYETCVRCGKVNYDKLPNHYEINTPVHFKGNQNTIPYWGTDEKRMDTTVSVFTVGDKTPGSTNGRLFSRPMCPECNERMKAINHARKADYITKVSKTPYHCSNKHKIVIHTKQQVMMGWSE